MAVLQGMNKVEELAKLTLIQQLTVMIVAWISLILGAGLYVAAVNSITSFIVLIFLYSRTKYPKLLLNTYKYKKNTSVSYKKEILPLQWKIAVSWISGYFIFQMFNPVIFAFEGPVAAGKMGMTLTLLNAILSFSLSWTTTKIPRWSILIANKDYIELDESISKVIRQSSIICIIIILLAIFILSGINYLGIQIPERFMPVWVCTILCLTIPVNNIVNAWATYLRCHKK